MIWRAFSHPLLVALLERLLDGAPKCRRSMSADGGLPSTVTRRIGDTTDYDGGFISSVLISSLETVWLHLVFAECIKVDIKHKSGRNDGSSRKLLISL